MKKLLLIVVLGLSVSKLINAQSDASLVRIAGVVYSEKYNEKAAFVHVINKRTGMGVISDSIGIFSINVNRMDTLLFHCLGFESSVFTIPDTANSKVQFARIKLEPKSYVINEVDVLALNSKSQFKYNFVNMEPDLTEKRIMIPGVTKYLEKEETLYPVSYNFMSPFSALYFKFSDEGESLRKLAALQKQDELDHKADLKYNEQVLFDISQYSEDTLQAFYKHLHFTNAYILSASEYQIYKRINDSLPLFNLRLSKDTAFLNKCLSR